MRITLTHREEKAGLFGTKKVHFIEAHIELTDDEEDVVRAQKLGAYHFITGGFSETDFDVRHFIGRRPMTIRFDDFYAAQVFEQEFRERLVDLKTYLDAGTRASNSTDTFEL